jgi:hypothetical protein
MPSKKTPTPPEENQDSLRATFNAIVDYHNKMALNRFTIAGLYLAATGFLVNSWFAMSTSSSTAFAIPLLGLAFTAVCLMLDIRTYQLMRNLWQRGDLVEKGLVPDPQKRFFDLMKHQPLRPELPFWGPELPPVVSHSLALAVLYSITSLFWIYALATLRA